MKKILFYLFYPVVLSVHLYNLIFLWNKLDPRWREFATCYVQIPNFYRFKSVMSARMRWKQFNEFLPVSVYLNNFETGKPARYGFSLKMRVIESVQYKLENRTVESVDKLQLKDVEL